jgi:large subunit ribosomal protein L1
MGSKKTVNVTSNPDEIKEVEVEKKTKETTDKAKEKTDKIQKKAKAQPAKNKTKKVRSKKYQAVRSKIDRTKTYDPFATIELAKKLSYTKFPGTITAHLTVKEQGLSQEITLPHSTGQTKKIEIASEEVMKKIEAGEINFDILLSTPQFMSKLTKYAPILGPKGLMPNPKNGTLTPNPEQKKKELEAGATVVKTEKKAPLMHVVIGKTDMDTKQLTENLQTLITAFKNKLRKVTLSATMSPGLRVEMEE